MKRFYAVLALVILVVAMAVPGIAVAKKAATGKPTFVSHPYTKKSTLKVNTSFTTWGYIKTAKNAPLTSESTVTIEAQAWNAIAKSWETSAGLTTSATVSATGKFKKKTNYKAAMSIGAVGRYRLRAKLEWTDTKGVAHTKWSSRKYIKLKK